VLLTEVAQVGPFSKLGTLECSSLGVQVGVCRSGVANSLLPSFDGVNFPTTSR
jgi:hypothetical protein